MTLVIDADFPGGNIVIDDIDGDVVRLHQDLGETTRAWFYWYFRIRGAAGRHIQFQLTSSRCLTARGPAISRDQGETWQWLNDCSLEDNRFSYHFAEDEDDVRFSLAMPYVWSDWQRFLDSWQHAELLREHALCTTRHGRQNVYYTMTGSAAETKRLVLSARHHCCEMMVNYSIEGLLEWWCASDEEAAEYLRQHLDLLLIPFVDLDGVEEGDQGKGRLGRDHARDYIGDSMYPETPALKSCIAQWSPELLIDLHCPGQRGDDHELIFQVGASDEATATEQRKLAALLEQVQQGPLPAPASDLLPFGTSWNTGANAEPGSGGIRKWATQELPHLRLATTFEIAYANVHGVAVTQDSARQFGPDLGRAIAVYLQGN